MFKDQEGNAEPTWEAQRNSQKAQNLKCSASQFEMLNVFYTSPRFQSFPIKPLIDRQTDKGLLCVYYVLEFISDL